MACFDGEIRRIHLGARIPPRLDASHAPYYVTKFGFRAIHIQQRIDIFIRDLFWGQIGAPTSDLRRMYTGVFNKLFCGSY